MKPLNRRKEVITFKTNKANKTNRGINISHTKDIGPCRIRTTGSVKRDRGGVNVNVTCRIPGTRK